MSFCLEKGSNMLTDINNIACHRAILFSDYDICHNSDSIKNICKFCDIYSQFCKCGSCYTNIPGTFICSQINFVISKN